MWSAPTPASQVLKKRLESRATSAREAKDRILSYKEQIASLSVALEELRRNKN